MAPIMILLLGVVPTTAVGTDLWFAGITKAVGGTIHHSRGTTDFAIVRRLAYGSIPFSILTLLALNYGNLHQVKQGFIAEALGVVLILTSIATVFRTWLRHQSERRKLRGRLKKIQAPATIIAGAILGVLVTLTSVGAGALCATVLVSLYPGRLSLKKVVGTDIVHAIPLTLVAGLGHLWLGNVDWILLVSLLVGSIPGIIIGSLLVQKVSDKFVQIGLAIILAIVGVRLMLT